MPCVSLDVILDERKWNHCSTGQVSHAENSTLMERAGWSMFFLFRKFKEKWGKPWVSSGYWGADARMMFRTNGVLALLILPACFWWPLLLEPTATDVPHSLEPYLTSEFYCKLTLLLALCIKTQQNLYLGSKARSLFFAFTFRKRSNIIDRPWLF